MDKNIAALIRDDTKTILVQFIQDRRKGEVTLLEQEFELSTIHYKYVTNLFLQVGDLVVVYAVGVPKIAVVSTVHDTLDISPDESIKYKWVVAKVDFSSYLANINKNKEIEQLISTTYQKNVKANFRNLLMNSMDAGAAARLSCILSDTKEQNENATTSY